MRDFLDDYEKRLQRYELEDAVDRLERVVSALDEVRWELQNVAEHSPSMADECCEIESVMREKADLFLSKITEKQNELNEFDNGVLRAV